MQPNYDAIANGLFALAMTLLAMLLLFVLLKFERLLDRYRLKYSFDRELESKEMGKENQEEKLNRRERLFKRRTFKD